MFSVGSSMIYCMFSVGNSLEFDACFLWGVVLTLLYVFYGE